jgi:hypothetical protein
MNERTIGMICQRSNMSILVRSPENVADQFSLRWDKSSFRSQYRIKDHEMLDH